MLERDVNGEGEGEVGMGYYEGECKGKNNRKWEKKKKANDLM